MLEALLSQNNKYIKNIENQIWQKYLLLKPPNNYCCTYFLGDSMVKLPKPTNEILDLFKEQESLTPNQINTSLPHFERKDIKYALRRLREKGIIVRVPNLFDMRRVYYRVATQDEFQSVSISMKSNEIEFYQAIMDTLLYIIPTGIEAEIN